MRAVAPEESARVGAERRLKMVQQWDAFSDQCGPLEADRLLELFSNMLSRSALPLSPESLQLIFKIKFVFRR